MKIINAKDVEGLVKPTGETRPLSWTFNTGYNEALDKVLSLAKEVSDDLLFAYSQGKVDGLIEGRQAILKALEGEEG